jgi:hypothetical protein
LPENLSDEWWFNLVGKPTKCIFVALLAADVPLFSTTFHFSNGRIKGTEMEYGEGSSWLLLEYDLVLCDSVLMVYLKSCTQDCSLHSPSNRSSSELVMLCCPAHFFVMQPLMLLTVKGMDTFQFVLHEGDLVAESSFLHWLHSEQSSRLLDKPSVIILFSMFVTGCFSACTSANLWWPCKWESWPRIAPMNSSMQAMAGCCGAWGWTCAHHAIVGAVAASHQHLYSNK